MTWKEILYWLPRLMFKRGFLPGSLRAVVKLVVLSWFDRRESVTAVIFGFRVHGPGYHTLLFLVKEIFLEQPYRFAASTPTPLIVDCGSNIGMSVLYFKLIYPGARIICFEPQARAFSLLQRNIHDNRLTSITAHQVALTNHNGIETFFEPASGAGLMASFFSDRETHGAPVPTPVRCLSGYIDGQPDMLKIDVEGAEDLILEDLLAAQKLGARNLVIEYHHGIAGTKLSLAGFLSRIESAGYRYSLLGNSVEPGQYQDLLIRCKRETV
jgi:FkbM family methyltransferase